MLLYNVILTAFLLIIYSYQLVFLLKGEKGRSNPAKASPKRIAVLIPAKDEEEIIEESVRSVLESDYDGSRLSVFVLADNCSDRTGDVAKRAGATVFYRSSEKRGKGYALEYLIRRVGKTGRFDGYLVLDADNTVEKDFISKISDSLSEGYSVAVGARIPARFGESAVGALSGMCFLYESVYLNRGRFALGGVPFVLGTGFAFTHSFLEEMGGWRFFSLTEDFEMCAYMALHGVRVRYTDSAVFYDPQPLCLRDSRSQRLRWTRGGGDVMRMYFARLISSLLKRPSLPVFDILFSFTPAFLFAVALILGAAVGTALTASGSLAPGELLLSLAIPILTVYIALLLFAAYVLHTEGRICNAGFLKKALYSLLFPLFIFSFFPIAVLAVLKKRVGWRKIRRR